MTGVSWYEAAAYAEFAGKLLPTIYHWAAAASPADGPSIIPASNFGGQGPARVGKYGGMSWSGTYDMAGNVKEWCLNEAISGKRYILGGAWNEPDYMFNDVDARSPFPKHVEGIVPLTSDAVPVAVNEQPFCPTSGRVTANVV